MADDDRSVRSMKSRSGGDSSSSSLPRCMCNWKSCRSLQRNFRDSDPSHELYNGVIRLKFKQADEASMRLKEAWDRYLVPDESKSESWKDGEVRYYVARHHFTEPMIQAYLKEKKTWDWTALVPEDDAEFLLFELNEDDSCPLANEELGFLKVPNVSKAHAKKFAATWVEEHPVKSKFDGDTSDSNLSVASTASTAMPGTAKDKSKLKKGKKPAPKSLDGLLKALGSTDDHSKKKPSSDEKSTKSSKSNKSSSKSKSKTSEDASKSPKSSSKSKTTKSRELTMESTEDLLNGSLSGKILSVPSNDEVDTRELGQNSNGAKNDLALAMEQVEALKMQVVELTQARINDQEALRASMNNSQAVDESSSELEHYKKKCRDLEKERDDLKAQNDKLQSLSDKRFEMVSTMEKKDKGELDAGRAREKELKAQLAEQTSKTAAVQKELEQAKAKVASVQKQMEDLQMSHNSETEDFILSVENLKKRIASLEEEHSNMLVEIDAGKAASRALETGVLKERSRMAEMEEEINQLKAKNRKLAIMSTPSGPEMSLQQAIETLQREKDALAVEKERLSTLNQNQKKIIRSLEGSTSDLDNEEARKRAQREDDLERGAALLANLYFTQKNMEELVEQSSSTGFSSSNDADMPNGGQEQAMLLKEVMERKQKKWWKSLDGIFSHGNYGEDDDLVKIPSPIASR